MGLLRDLVKVVAAPVYIPYKVVKKAKEVVDDVTGSSNYNHWYHDGGQGEPSDDYEKKDE